MKNGKKFVSIKTKVYIFAAITILVVALGTAAITFTIGSNQINNYYKQNATDNARNAASMLDGDYLALLRTTAESEEFQALRERAEEEDNDGLIEDYLKAHDLWDKYADIRSFLSEYLSNVEGIEYLYIMAHGDIDSLSNMYLVDDNETPFYETGLYEPREVEFLGVDLTALPEPVISNGDWGWLCSAYAPVYDSEGNCICIVGCDINMDTVMAERSSFLISVTVGAIVYTVFIILGAMLFMNDHIVKPLRTITNEIKNFTPSEYKDYDTAGVMELELKNCDEISEMYQGIRNMQISIIDYLKDKVKAENDLRNRDQKIDKLNDETYKDALTGVGSMAAFNKKSEVISRQAVREGGGYAVVMIDMNNLKHVNDEYGHKAGDMYITGCCRLVSDVFRHSKLFRIGGDEFVAILQGADYDNRFALTERLKSEFVDSFSQEDKEPWLRYSAAVGMAEHSSDDTSFESVFKRADKAMYEDKESFKKLYGSVR